MKKFLKFINRLISIFIILMFLFLSACSDSRQDIEDSSSSIKSTGEIETKPEQLPMNYDEYFSEERAVEHCEDGLYPDYYYFIYNTDWQWGNNMSKYGYWEYDLMDMTKYGLWEYDFSEWSKDVKNGLYLYDNNSRKTKMVYEGNISNMAVDGKSVYFVLDCDKIYRINDVNEEAELLYQHETNFKRDMVRRYKDVIFFVSEDNEVYRLHIETGSVDLIWDKKDKGTIATFSPISNYSFMYGKIDENGNFYYAPGLPEWSAPLIYSGITDETYEITYEDVVGAEDTENVYNYFFDLMKDVYYNR